MGPFDKPAEGKKERPQESVLAGFEAAHLIGDRSAFSSMQKQRQQQEQQAQADAAKGNAAGQQAAKMAMLGGFSITGATHEDTHADLSGKISQKRDFDVNRIDGGYSHNEGNRSFGKKANAA
jgi:hypothetical protein